MSWSNSFQSKKHLPYTNGNVRRLNYSSKRNITNKKKLGEVDRTMLVAILLLAAFGILIVYEASVVYSANVFGGKYHYLLYQAGWVFIGLIGMLIMSRIDIDLIKKYSFYIFILSIVLLLVAVIPNPFAKESLGGNRWIIINPESLLPAFPILGRLSFQPSEFAKLASIIYFPFLITRKGEVMSHKLVKIFLSFIIVVGLIAIEPDFTTAAILACILIGVFFVSNLPIFYFVISLPFLIGIAIFYAFSADYRRLRIQTLFSPESIDNSGAGYHIRQIMIAMGSGGPFGLGFGKSRQKYLYLPEVTADSIFAIVGEEFGFLGTSLLISLFALVIFRGVKIAQYAKDKYCMLVASGVVFWVAIQMFINLLAMVRLIPLTGIPLPMISYGGSATVFILLSLGLVLNVSRNDKIHE